MNEGIKVLFDDLKVYIDKSQDKLRQELEKRMNDNKEEIIEHVNRKIEISEENIRHDIKAFGDGYQDIYRKVDKIEKDVEVIKEKVEEHDIILLAQRRAK